MKTLKLFVLAAISICLCARAGEPAIRLVSPEDGAVFTAGEPILLQAEPRSGAQLGAIQKVEFVSRAVIGEATSAPFSVSWQGAPAGIIASLFGPQQPRASSRPGKARSLCCPR